MKRVFLLSMCAIFVLVMTGCNISVTPSHDLEGQDASFDIGLSGMPSASTKGINDDEGVAHVYIKVFQDATRKLLPIVGDSGTGITELLWDKTTASYKGTVSLQGSQAGTIRFLAFGTDAEGKHLYAGSQELTVGSGTSITIPTNAGYTAMDWGPGGGYIVSVNNDEHKYLELAPKGWSGTLGTTADSGVYQWGDEASFKFLETSTTLGEGLSNTQKIAENINKIQFDSGVAMATIEDGGKGYKPGDTFIIHQEGAGPLCAGEVTEVLEEQDGAVSEGRITNAGLGYTVEKQLATESTSGGGSGLVLNVTQLVQSAAHACLATVNGFSDWALPSSEDLEAINAELKVMSEYYALVGIEDDTTYWASSDYSEKDAWTYNYRIDGSGGAKEFMKTTNTLYARPVRYF